MKKIALKLGIFAGTAAIGHDVGTDSPEPTATAPPPPTQRQPPRQPGTPGMPGQTGTTGQTGTDQDNDGNDRYAPAHRNDWNDRPYGDDWEDRDRLETTGRTGPREQLDKQ